MCQYQLGISFSLPLSLSIDFSQYLRLQSFWLAELLFTRWKPTNILVWFWWIVAFNLRKSAAAATITIPTKTVRRDDENTLKKKKPSNESQFESMWKIKCKLIYLYAIDLSKTPELSKAKLDPNKAIEENENLK